MNTIESVKHEESSISYYGWTVTGMSFLANVIGYGIVLAFGVFLKPLAAEFGWSRSLITGAFTLYAVLHNFLAIFTGRLADRFGPRILALIGGLCIGSGTLLMMFIGSIWQVYLLYGIFLAIGVSCLYAPLLSNVSKWFHKKRGRAIGITAGGVGAASLIFSPLSAALITAYGWRTAYMSLGITCWLVFIPVVLLMRSPQPIHIGRQQYSFNSTARPFI